MMWSMVLLVLSQSRFSPGEVQDIFLQGNRAYSEGRPAEALMSYEKLIESHQANSDVLFNAGTASLVTDNLGKAIVYLERVKKLEGTSSELETQMRLARAKIKAPPPTLPSLESWADTVSQWVGGAWAYGLFVLSWVSALGSVLFRHWKRRVLVFRLSAILWSCCLFFGMIFALQGWADKSVQHAVIVQQTVPLRASPNAQSAGLFSVHEGVKVRVLDHQGEFVFVRLSDGAEGWLKAVEVMFV